MPVYPYLSVLPYTFSLILSSRPCHVCVLNIKDFWCSHLSTIEEGVVQSGRLEQYIAKFSQEHLPTVVSPEQVVVFFNAASLEEQRQIFNQFPLQELEKVTR